MMWPLVGLLWPISDGNPNRSGCQIDGAYTPARAVTCTGRAQPNGGAGERARDGACITVASRVHVPQLEGAERRSRCPRLVGFTLAERESKRVRGPRHTTFDG